MKKVKKELKFLELENLLLRKQKGQLRDQKLESRKRINRVLQPN